MRHGRIYSLMILAILLVAGVCRRQDSVGSRTEPARSPEISTSQTPSSTPPKPKYAPEMVDLIQAGEIKKRRDQELMNIPGVVGTGLSRDSDGAPVIEVYVERLSPKMEQSVPAELEGVRVRIVVTGAFQARENENP